MERNILFCLEAEFATLNYLLTTPDSVSVLEALGRLRPDYYSDKVHRKIFELLQQVYMERGVDAMYLLEHYPEHRDRIQRIMQSASILNVERFGNAVDSLEEAYQRRVVEQAGKEILAIALNRDVRRPYSAAYNALVKHPVSRSGRGGTSSISSIADGYLTGGRGLLGGPALQSGLARFDRVMRGNLIAMVGGTHSGKTWFSVNLCLGYLLNGCAGSYYSLDGSKRQVFEKMLSIHSEVDYRAILARHAMDAEQEQRMTTSVRAMKDLPIEIHDDKVTLGEIVNDLYHAKRLRDIKFAIVDGGDLLPEDLGRVIAQLSRLSYRTDVPVFLFARGSTNNLRDYRSASTVVQVCKEDAPESDQLRLKVIKSDDGPAGGTLFFDWNPRTGTLKEKNVSARMAVHTI